MTTPLLLATACAAALAVPAACQEPAGPPPPSRHDGQAGSRYLELLPDIGRIGAEVGAFGAASFNPYGVGRGWQAGGFIDLPLARLGGGRVSYEIVMALSGGRSDPFVITDPLAYVANLASGASRADALAGPPRAPFPVRRAVRTRLRVLQVAPFSLKYTITALDRARLRPYVAAGVDVAVVTSDQLPVADESADFHGTAPFDDPLIGGVVAQAPELTERGLPSGQGNVELGGHATVGLEARLSRGLSLNVEYRFTSIGEGHVLHAAGAGLGIHW